MVAPINVIVSYEAGNSTNVTQFVCRKNQEGSAAVILTPALLGVLTNMYIMLLIVGSHKLRRTGKAVSCFTLYKNPCMKKYA